MTKTKDWTSKKFEKRAFKELQDDNYLITNYGPALIFDYMENPYTMFYFIFKEGWGVNHVNLMKIILKKFNKENFTVLATDDVADIIKDQLSYLLAVKLVVEYGIDNDNDINYAAVYNYSFIDSVEDQVDGVLIKINKDFYVMMDKYFELEKDLS